MPKTLPLRLYNLRVGRSNQQANREIRALLADRPAVLALNEAMGYRLTHVKGYRLIRDTSRPGRANIAAYVRTGLRLRKVRWHDCRMTWPRTEHPGTHPARSWVEFKLNGAQVIVGHQPPKLPPRSGGRLQTTRCQREGIELLRKRMAPWQWSAWLRVNTLARKAAQARVRVVLADFNRRPGEDGWGPSTLARQIGGQVVGARIDCAVIRGASARRVEYVTEAAGVRLLSDHKEAFAFDLVVD